MSQLINDDKLFKINQKKIEELKLEDKAIEIAINDTDLSFPNGGVIVKLPDKKKGIALAIYQPNYFTSEYKKVGKLMIKTLDGLDYLDLTIPELYTDVNLQVKIAGDEDFLYATFYNSNDSYLIKYSKDDFSLVWKKKLNSSNMQSITISDNFIICFNAINGTFDYFNKNTGVLLKDIDIKKNGGYSSHNIDNNKFTLFTVSPGGGWINNKINQLKIFSVNGSKILQNNISTKLGYLNVIGVDYNLNLFYLVFNNRIEIFNTHGYQGTIIMPTSDIMELNVDKETSALIISSININNVGGKITILPIQAIKELIYFKGKDYNELSSLTNDIKSLCKKRKIW